MQRKRKYLRLAALLFAGLAALAVAATTVLPAGASPLAQRMTGTTGPAVKGRISTPGPSVSAWAKAHSALAVSYNARASRYYVDLPAAANPAEAEAAAATFGARVTVRRSRYTQVGIDEVAAMVRSAWQRAGRKYTYAFYFSAAKDQTLVSTDAPATVRRNLSAELGRAAEVDYSQKIGRTDRSNDSIPYHGGIAIVNTTNKEECTAGFAITFGGFRYMVTAGHCGGLGVIFDTQTDALVGTQDGSPDYPAADVAIIGDVSQTDPLPYQGRIFVGPASGAHGVGVTGASNPVVESKYCFSGAVSGEVCNITVEGENGELCTKNGCTKDLYIVNHVFQSGDSGAPFYEYANAGNTEVSIAGIVVGDDATLGDGYVQGWGTIQGLFSGSTILTG